MSATPDRVGTRRAGAVSAFASLFASGTTLVCCALPALLVALGAGVTLSSLIATVPQIVWLSEHKAEVFSVATVLLALAGALQLRDRRAPCPLDPALRDTCLRTRRLTLRAYLMSVVLFGIGGWFAFLAPWLHG